MTPAGINLTHDSWLTRVAVTFDTVELMSNVGRLWQKNDDDNWEEGGGGENGETAAETW